MTTVSPLFARLCAGFGLLSVAGIAAGANDLPRFMDRRSRPAPARLDSARQHAAYDLSSIPVYFEKDPAAARFQTRTANSGLLFDRGGFWIGFGPAESSVHVTFPGARRGANPTGQKALPAFSNYFLGENPSQWSTRRQHYAGVRYDALWQGIDLVFYAQRSELEYDFNVAPHADAGKIRLRVDGADSVNVDEHGELWIVNQYGKTKQRRPVIYQEVDGRRQAVDGGYRMQGKNQVGFWLGAYDRSRKLVIDPVLEFATYIGGRGYELATGVAVDSKNNIYVTGYTQFADFTTTPAARRLGSSQQVANVFLVKLDANTKQIVYIVFYGGSTYEIPLSVAVDSTGAATVIGETQSFDLPRVNAILTTTLQMPFGYSYGFAARFAPDGSSLAYSTYLAPGSAYGVAVNSTGSAWVVGVTICYTFDPAPRLHEFQPTSGAQQTDCTAGNDAAGYLVQIAPGGSKQYASYFVPANANGNFNYLNDVAVDSQDNVYTAGTMTGQSTVNRAIPQPDGSYLNELQSDSECQVAKFDRAGHLTWLKPLGGSRDEECLRVAVDAASAVYVTGYTTSTNFPVTPAAFQRVIGSPGQIPNVEKSILGDVSTRPLFDAFVSKYNALGQLTYSTYLGGNGDDYAWGIAVTGSGNAYVTGYTNSRNFPITPGAAQTTYGGGQGDAFVTGITPDGNQQTMSTFFGGSGQDEGYQVALDGLGNAYMAGGTESSDLPVTSDAFQRTVQGGDAMVAKFNLQTCNPAVTLANPVLGAGSGSTSLSLKTDTPGCAWTLATTAPWIQFSPASGSGNQTITLTVTANSSPQSRLAILTANSRRTFVYQSGQSPCQYVVQPGEMALTSNSERHQIVIQAADPTCAWTATASQSWLHLLSPANGKGTGAITIGTEQNNTATVRTATVTIGNRSIVVGQSAGGCAIKLSGGSLEFSPAGGLGMIEVVAGSNQCSWQAQTTNSDWIGFVANTNFGSGKLRFSVLPNSSGQPRTGVISVGSQTATISQDSIYRDLKSNALNSPNTVQTAQSPLNLSPSMVRASRGRLAKLGGVPLLGTGGGCNSVKPPEPINLNAAGDAVTFTVNRARGGCTMTASWDKNTGFTISPTTVSISDPANVTFRVTAGRNTNTKPLDNSIMLGTGDPSLAVSTWHLTVTQAGSAVAPLDVPPVKALQPVANSDAIPVSSTNGNPCDWAVDTGSVPPWVTLNSSTGSCGSQLQFSYTANTTSSQRTGMLKFATGEVTQLDQLAGLTPCTFSFQQTTPPNVTLNGGQVTFNVQTSPQCTWTPSTDSPDWITFPSGGSTGPGPLVVQVGANDTLSKRAAQISVDAATVWVTEDPALSFPTGCVYTLSPTSNSFPNTGGPFTFQVQTTANCTWQASQPTADASFVHLQSTANVTGPGSVTFTVDTNPAGSAARSSSITVAPGTNFGITQAAGAAQGCSYTLSPTSTTFTNAGGSFSFQVQTSAGCQWQTGQPSSDTWVHIQTGSNGNGPGTVSFTVDPNPAGAAARSSSIGVATATFSISEAAGSGPAIGPSLSASGVANSASYATGSVSPGEFVTLFGSNMGPAQLVSSAVVAGKFATAAGGTQVLFDGVAAPMIYSSAAQVTAIVPYAVAGKPSTQMQVSYNGATSAPVTMPVVAAVPGLFTAAATGTGQGAILNQDLTVNSATNPASPGQLVVLFGTGEGQTKPGGQDGLVAASATPLPVLPVTVTIGGVDAVVPYAGAAPGLVAGVLQVNAIVPAGLQGNQPVVVSVGGKASAGGVTVALKGTAAPPSGALRANPNPLNVCTGGATSSVTLTWSTSNVTAVKILAGSISGTVVASGGANGSVTVTAAPNTTYLLVDVSSGGTPSQANVLSTVTLQQGTCATPASGSLTASPNPLNVCSATTLANVTLTWSTTNVTSVKVTSGSLAGSAVATGGASGSVTLAATPGAVYVLVDTSGGGTPTSANVLSQVTLQQGACTAAPAGTLTVTPNPLNVCTATSTASATLAWTATNVTSVKVVVGSLTGAMLATGGASGSVTLMAAPNTTYLLVDTSGGTPTSANILSSVTTQQGTCPSQAGAAPPTGDLAQSILNWQIQFLNNGSPAQGGAADQTSPANVLSGASSMYVYSITGNQIVLTRAAAAGGWDVSKISTIQMAMQSSVPPGLWVAGSPYFRFTSANGTLTLTPVIPSIADPSYIDWTTLTAPLAGNASWTATQAGQFNAQNVTSIQVGLNVVGTNWAVLLNAMFLK